MAADPRACLGSLLGRIDEPLLEPVVLDHPKRDPVTRREVADRSIWSVTPSPFSRGMSKIRRVAVWRCQATTMMTVKSARAASEVARIDAEHDGLADVGGVTMWRGPMTPRDEATIDLLRVRYEDLSSWHGQCEVGGRVRSVIHGATQ
jgi:hypothetical protein